MGVKYMKKIVALTMAIMFLILNGCNLWYGKNVYLCDSDNMLGFRSAFIRGDHITFKFDEEYALREDDDYRTLKELFENGEFPDGWSFSLKSGYSSYEVRDSDNLTVDPKNLTISFDKSGATEYDVKGFIISSGEDTWVVDFNKETIQVNHTDGETVNIVIQHHDIKDDFWYPIETYRMEED